MAVSSTVDYFKILCLVCGAELSCVNWSHLKSHGMTTDEYAEQFPGAPMACQAQCDRLRDLHTGKVQSAEHVEKRVSRLRGLTRPDIWSPEIRAKVGKSLLGRKFSDSHRKKISEANKRQWVAGSRQLTFKPKWEQDVAAWLVAAGIEFHHQFHIPGFSHPYDFYIPGINLLIELDGCFWHGCACQGGAANDFICKNISRDCETELIAKNFGYSLVRIRECEFSQDYFMEVCRG